MVSRGVMRSSFVIPEGESLHSAFGGTDLPWVDLNASRTIAHVKNPEDIFYNDMNDEEAQRWIAKLQTQSEGVYTTEVTYAAWRHIPTTFVRAVEDRSSITEEVVDYMINQEQLRSRT